jgi:DNA-binding transcriptional MerR regulator
VDEERYTLQELADAAGVSPRTVRYYIAEALLPPPEPAGHKTSYTRDHLTRLKLIGLLKEAYQPLRTIREQLVGIGNEDLDRALAEAERARGTATQTIADHDITVDSSLLPPRSARRTTFTQPTERAHERESRQEEDALAYIDRVLGKQRPAWAPPKPPRTPPERDKVWRRLTIGSGGDAELVISEALYQRRRERIDALLVWAEKMLEQD